MKIGLLGHGVVGSGVRKIIDEKLTDETKNLEITRILVKDTSEITDVRMTTDVNDILLDPLRGSKLKGTGQYADIEIIFEEMMELRVNGRRKNNVEFKADPYDAEMKISITFPYRDGIVTDMRMIEGNVSVCVLEATFIKDGQESLMYFTDGSEEGIYFHN